MLSLNTAVMRALVGARRIPRREHKHAYGDGFTLIECSVALAVLAILATMAVPQLSQFQRSALRRATLNDFMHSIFLARNTAIMRNSVVSICRSSDGETCANRTGNWEDGWIVFENLDHDQPATRDADEPIIHRHAAWPRGRVTSNRVSFSFRPFAQGDVTGTIIICDPRDPASEARAIIISHTGRPRISKRDASNHPLTCS